MLIVDEEKIKDSIDRLNTGKKCLESGKNILNTIEIPENFIYKGELNRISIKLNTILKRLNVIEKWMIESVNKFKLSERKNKDVISKINNEALLKLGTKNTIQKNETVKTIDENTVDYKIWRKLKKCGLSDIQIAAILGNLYYESGGLDPSIVERGYDEYNGGIGIAQWTNYPRSSGKGRNTQLKEFAKSQGVDWTNLNIQIRYLIAEITGKGKAFRYMSPEYPAFTDQCKMYSDLPYSKFASKEGFLSAKTVEEANAAILYSYENPTCQDASNSYEDRLKASFGFYVKYHYANLSKEDKNLEVCNEIVNKASNSGNNKKNNNVSTNIEKVLIDNNELSYATYVNLYLYESGQMLSTTINKYDINSINDNDSKKGLITMLKDKNWLETNKSNLHSGDILVNRENGYAAVYISDGVIYDKNSLETSNKAGKSTKRKVSTKDYNEFMNNDKYVAYTSPDNLVINDGEGIYIAKVSSNGLNVREQPDANSQKKTVLGNGEEVIIKEEKNGWGKIIRNGEEGWIKLEYTEKEK